MASCNNRRYHSWFNFCVLLHAAAYGRCAQATNAVPTTNLQSEPATCQNGTIGRGLTEDSAWVGDSKKASLNRGPLAGYVDHFVKSYHHVVKDEVAWQTSAWNLITKTPGVNEVEMGSCPRTKPRPKTTRPSLPPQQLELVEWDDEADSARYLDGLRDGCALDGDSPEFQEGCWDALTSLVFDSRCTTRFDSRVNCQRGVQTEPRSEQEGHAKLLRELDHHFSQDTVNVVIVGAGPTGLFLANALTEMNVIGDATWRPSFRVAVVESRLDAVGVKRPYTRNWGTAMDLRDFIHVIDPRVSKILHTISESRAMFALSIHAIETLLMVSDRAKGVKFIYDDLEKYTDFLSTQPNLLVFDATGHRLNGLIRGSHCPRPDPTPGIQSKIADAREIVRKNVPNFEWMDRMRYEVLEEYDHLMSIAQKGDILYPVTPEGRPYSAWWLHIDYISVEAADIPLDDYWWTFGNETSLCEACNTNDYYEFSAVCDSFCRTHYFYGNEERYYRPDISIENKYYWTGGNQAEIQLTGRQAKALQELIQQHNAGKQEGRVKYGPEQHDHSIPINELPIEAISNEPVFQEGRLDQVLAKLASLSGAVEGHRHSLVSVFQHRPFVYKNGEIPGDLFGASTPMLRIGDSLASGDTTHSTGLRWHVWMIRRLLCKVRGFQGDCSRFEYSPQVASDPWSNEPEERSASQTEEESYYNDEEWDAGEQRGEEYYDGEDPYADEQWDEGYGDEDGWNQEEEEVYVPPVKKSYVHDIPEELWREDQTAAAIAESLQMLDASLSR